MRRLSVAAAVAAIHLIAPEAMAGEGFDAIAAQAIGCWNLPAALQSKPEIVFDVQIDASGTVTDIAVVSYSPGGEAGREAVLSASRAIELCAPYDVSGKPGQVRVKMRLVEKPLIDPFGPLGD